MSQPLENFTASQPACTDNLNTSEPAKQIVPGKAETNQNTLKRKYEVNTKMYDLCSQKKKKNTR